MNLVLHPTLPSQIIKGPRVTPGVGSLTDQSQAQDVLVAIVKATFAIDDPSATPLPSNQQIALLKQDVFFPSSGPSSGPMRYESDLAVFKPQTDVVVLGAPAPPQPGPLGGTWTETVQSNGTAMQNAFPLPSHPPPPDPPLTFGWEDRLQDPRKGYAGACDVFKPDTMKLPLTFNNLFWNGGTYQGPQPLFGHPAPGAIFVVQTSAQYSVAGNTVTQTKSHQLCLPNSAPQAVITYRTGAAPNAPTTSQALEMDVDTIVYDKDAAQFYAVWRGVWEYSSVPADRYVSLVLS